MNKKVLTYLLMMLSTYARADIQFEPPECYIKNHHLYLSQNYQINLTSEPISALKSGIELHFNFVITLKQKGQLWPAQGSFKRERVLRYDHISRQFIVTGDQEGIQQSFNNAETAVQALGQIDKWRVTPITAAPPQALRGELRLNLNKLPVALRLSTLFDKAWQLNSETWTCQLSA